MSVVSPSKQSSRSDEPKLTRLRCSTDALCRPRRLTAPQSPGLIDQWCRRAAVARLDQLQHGGLTVRDVDQTFRLGRSSGGERTPVVTVHSPRFWRMLVQGGSLSAAESYLRGDWDCDDLTSAMRLLARESDVLQGIDAGWARLLSSWRNAANRLRLNTRRGSRRNIAAHYDLSNEFFALLLDRTMTYSAGLFDSSTADLEQASLTKFERICRKLQLTPDDRLLEIGCGWGGFAMYAAAEYGCHVTATTVSAAQFEYARCEIDRRGLGDRITLLQTDYRDLQGRYDKLVSIEMIEAVGERFLDAYFRRCSRLLQPGGAMLLQSITMPEHRLDRYRRTVDFIQQYIFPGGFLPAVSLLQQSMQRTGGMQIDEQFDMTQDYALTLAHWRANFWNRIDEVRELGFDERFIRMWHYYLCFSETGFHERLTGVAQFLLRKAS